MPEKPSTDALFDFLWNLPTAEGYHAMSRNLGPDERAFIRIVDIVEEARESPWAGDGPTIEEAGGEMIQIRTEQGGLWPAHWEEDRGLWLDTATYLPTGEKPPVSWRRMPTAPGKETAE
jgi:hypothetical protein